MSLQHVTLELREADTCRPRSTFWALLGFERVEPPPPLNEVAAWVQRDGTQIHFLFTDEPIVPQGGHVAVVADDLRRDVRPAARRRLRARGAPAAVGRGARVRAHARGPPRGVHG